MGSFPVPNPIYISPVSSSWCTLHEREREMWPFSSKGPSGFNWYSTAEEVTQGIDGSGLTAIVTGASAGIGAETTRVLAMRGVRVIMAVRNLSSGENVKQSILKESPTAKIDILELDLSSLASVRKFDSEFNALNIPLNILINNAGIMACPFSLSKDGFEMQFATSHIGHFLLTNLLLENMKNTSGSSGVEGRIVIVSSEAHKFPYSEGIRFEKINDDSGYNSMWAYGQSKLANILHANELSRRLQEESVQITVNSLHPGTITTNIFRYHSYFNYIVQTVGRLMMKDVGQGAATTCYVAMHPQVTGVSGKYFNNCNIYTPTTKATDKDMAKKLWELSMKMVN